MEQIRQFLEILRDINQKNGLSNDTIDNIMNETKETAVCTPIIGGFSTGKSALINALVKIPGMRLLKEDITPETAVPAELLYSQTERAVVSYKNGTETELSPVAAAKMETPANEIDHIRFCLNHDFLASIPDVMIVDMPGFDSGFEIHNKAIDMYLPRSMAYIIAIPAENMVLTSSIGNILHELSLNDMPICVAITKCDKDNVTDDFDEKLAQLRQSLAKYVGNREIPVFRTSSREGDVDELRSFLIKDIQTKSEIILANSFKAKVQSQIAITNSFLDTRLQNMNLSESELDEERDRLISKFNNFDKAYRDAKLDFEDRLYECRKKIVADVDTALRDQEETYIAHIMNKQDFKSSINTTVRSAATTSIRANLIPLIESYLHRVSKMLNDCEIDDFIIPEITVNLNKGKAGTVVTSILATLLIPFGLIIGPILSFVMGNKRREKIKQEIRQKLESDVYPQVMSAFKNNLEATINKQIADIYKAIEENIALQRETYEKAIDENKAQSEAENAQKQSTIADITGDIKRLKEMNAALA